MRGCRTTKVASKEGAICASWADSHAQTEHLLRMTPCTSRSAERESDSSGEVRPTAAQIPDSELSVIEITPDGIVNHCSNGIEPRECSQRGEKVNGVVMPSRHGVGEHVSCMLAHDLLNKVTAVIGFCDLLASDQTDNQREIHLQRLRLTAWLIADMLNERPCSLVVCSSEQQELVETCMERESPERVEPKVYERSSSKYLANSL
jgi:hypothetical protein